MKKIRMIGFIFLVVLLLNYTAAIASSPYKIYEFNNIKWMNAFPGLKLPHGTQVAVLDGNPTKAEPFIMRIKFPPGFKLLPHTHPSAEHSTVLYGVMNFGYGSTFDVSHLIKVTTGG